MKLYNKYVANCNPISWGEKTVFPTLLGTNRETWNNYDGSEVVKRYDGPRREILADQVNPSYAFVCISLRFWTQH